MSWTGFDGFALCSLLLVFLAVLTFDRRDIYA